MFLLTQLKSILHLYTLLKRQKTSDLLTFLGGARAYFRIERKHPTCSKMASNLGNTSWNDSQKLMRVLMTIGLNRLSSLHITSWHITHFTVSYFLSEILRIRDNSRNRNLEIFTRLFFPRNSQRYHYWIVKSTEWIFLRFCKDLPTMQWRKVFYNHPHNILRLFDFLQFFTIFYQIDFSPELKRSVIISNKHGIIWVASQVANQS